ncbi:CoA transferase [Streptomyces sp. NPDC001941]|uniref:CoA transferase n=1 Tax=Streptomyces sp. NPDC001941 TaxID=3154659 RepID=UPI003316CB30
MTTTPSSGTARAWAALGGDPALVDGVAYGGPGGGLPSRLPVAELARATVAACSLAAAELASVRAGAPVARVRVDEGRVAAAFLSDRLVRLDGRAPTTFAPLSRFWRTADGWVRTHANYPHHRARLLGALGLPEEAGPEALGAVLAERRAADVEEAAYAAGGLAVAVRTREQWARGEQGLQVARQPLLTSEPLGDGQLAVPGADAALPCAGLRVLDLTRVLAGPIATRTLALLGADVLRIDTPRLPEAQDAHDDTGLGKRSALVDLESARGRADFGELLASAHVVVTGYRPGALDRFGLAPGDLAARRPGLTVAQVSAWGPHGPWRARRGFDSLVQAATGIALLEGSEGSEREPGALPAQALDHGSGYLLAAGVLRALALGGGRLVRLSLARTGHWLTGELAGEPHAQGAPDHAAHLVERDTSRGRLRYALPAVGFEGGPSDWARPSGQWGADPARWSAPE